MNNLLVWPVMVPLLAVGPALIWRRRAEALGLIATVATAAASLVLVWQVAEAGPLALAVGGWQPGLGIALYADPLAATLLAMCGLIAVAAGIPAGRHVHGDAAHSLFWPLWLLLLAALNALLLSGDLFNIYVTLELLGLAAVGLTAFNGQREAVAAALRYLTVGLLGSLLYLAGVTIVYAGYGTLDIATLRNLVLAEPSAWVALALMSAGLFVKAALFPLHFWLPPAHANAAPPISAVLSALVVKVAFYLLLRLWLDLFQPTVTPAAAWLLGLLGAAAILWGSWHALNAQRLKLLAAYSTVAQLGYLFVFFPLLVAAPTGVQRDQIFGAAVLLALTHGFAKSALFIAAGTVRERFGHDRIDRLAGAAYVLPLTVFTLALSGIALIGLPPSGSFLAKWQLISSAFLLDQWVWILIVALGTLMSAAYVFRVLGYAFRADATTAPKESDYRAELPAMALAITATAVLGFGAFTVWDFVGPAIAPAETIR